MCGRAHVHHVARTPPVARRAQRPSVGCLLFAGMRLGPDSPPGLLIVPLNLGNESKSAAAALRRRRAMRGPAGRPSGRHGPQTAVRLHPSGPA
jgi:hypothetical protein